MKRYLLIIALCGILLSCGNNNNRRTNEILATESGVVLDTPALTAEPDTDYTGTYKGHLPCADCGGIEVRLKLDKDGDYQLNTRHISDKEGEKDIEAEYEGSYTWNQSNRTVTLAGITNQPNRYLYSDGTMIQLDMEGKRIEGPLADRYVLTKK